MNEFHQIVSNFFDLKQSFKKSTRNKQNSRRFQFSAAWLDLASDWAA